MSLLVWLPLNGNLENKGLSKAQFSIEKDINNIYPQENGKLTEYCYKREKINKTDYITSDINFKFPKDFSMCCWCKVTEFAGTSANGIITNHDHQTGGAGINIKVIDTTPGSEKCYISCSAGFGPNAAAGERIYNHKWGTTNIFGAWHHLCLTYQRSSETYKLYVDGQVENTFIFKDAIAERPFCLFDWSTSYSTAGSYKPACELNDVRLYDHCLSIREVKDLASGLFLHYKLNEQENEMMKIKDSSGYNNNGVLFKEGTFISNASAHYNSNLKLENKNYIRCSRKSDNTITSASMWLKTEKRPEENQVVFADYYSGLAFGFYGDKNVIVSCQKSATVFTGIVDYWKENEWNHIVITKDNNVYKCYINNNKLTALTNTNNWSHYAENVLTIGCRNNGDYSTYYTGEISDFRLYATILAADDINQLYQTPISLSNNYTLFANEFIEEHEAKVKFNASGDVVTNKITNYDLVGATNINDQNEIKDLPLAEKMQIFANRIQSTDFIEW